MKKLKKFFLTSFLIFFPLIIVELFFSIFFLYKENKTGILFNIFKYQKINKQIEYEIKLRADEKIVPGKYIHKFNGKEITYQINRQGFRGDDFNIKKTHEFRMIAFGGSSTIGIESFEHETYPKVVESLMKSKKFDFEVLNFGLSGKSLNFIEKTFFTEALDYNPDIISINSNRNSIVYDSLGPIKDTLFKNPKITKLIFFLDENIMIYRFLKKMYNKILILNTSKNFFISPYNPNSKHYKSYFLNEYKETLNKIILYCKKKNIMVVLIKQPVNFNFEIQKKIKNENNKNLFNYLENYKSDGFFNLNYVDSFMIITTTILNNNLDKFANQENVIIINTINDRMLVNDNFYDQLHLTPKGNEILGEMITLEIMQRLY